MTNFDHVSVIGLGKLGLCLAAVFAKKGMRALGIDIEERVVGAINAGRAPIIEPGIDELISQTHGKSLFATMNHLEAIEDTDVTFILVATPSNPDGSFSNRYIESVLKLLGQGLRDSPKPYHLFVISSTVEPGSMEESFIPLLEQHSGRKLNEGFGICYDPDFVALGDVINGFLKPELVVIGESSTKAGDIVESIHNRVVESEPRVSRMSLASAEMAKVALNAYITVKISFANNLANLCEKIPGADVDAITEAIGTDRRISPYYFKGGMSYGGTCFPRDTRAYINISERLGFTPDLIHAVENINRFQDDHLADVVLNRIADHADQVVGVLGLAFKVKTPVITESAGIKLIERLLTEDVEIIAYDPLAVEAAKVIFEDRIEYVSSAADCVPKANILVVINGEQEFIDAIENFKPTNELVVIDSWRILDPAKLDQRITYVPWGYSEGTFPKRK